MTRPDATHAKGAGLKPIPALLRLALAALFLLPLLFMVLAAFRPAGSPLTSSLWTGLPTVENFRKLFSILPIGRYTLNSLLVAAVAVPLTVLTASWAGFAMARLPRPTQRRWVLLSLLVLMIPGVALWSSRFILYSRLGIGGTLWTLIVPAFMGTSPFFVLIFYRAFRRIPTAIYDSARLEGAGVLATWGRVALPMARPTAVAVAALAFILYWGDYISPLLYLGDAARYTLPVGLQLLAQLGRSNYPLLLAGALWSTLLPLLLVVGGVLAVAAVERAHARKFGSITGQSERDN
ncbi:MAG: carbohydrate ABC transporter permease [Anaerolineae bacterium]|uniref:carbohydrate ABC transporter permease n=1 Tax=Promineifilum sp. TaxID=2664178 RepID=UPI001D43A0EE|nr:carbohydrate ABC transporter permease [Anaerolineales bacterium]MCB8936301.1 carbohydrate ABC transporter permease [Promineifilum sp.]MCO5180152.1 carbohydrate ABC transporter permease [Promineifilum sp.]MCW5847510.1 carbohydrate ABC transporter permease [Anaerolineae bacterium]